MTCQRSLLNDSIYETQREIVRCESDTSTAHGANSSYANAGGASQRLLRRSRLSPRHVDRQRLRQ